MMYVLDKLPLAEVNKDIPRSEGVLVTGAHVANAIVSVLHGPKVGTPSFTVGIQGRGTLNMPEPEFKQLLGTMASLYRAFYDNALPVVDLPKADGDVAA